MNARRRLAYVAAVNIYSDALFSYEREPGDRWFFDPRLSPRLQAGNEYYADNPLDRGHLVRRDDAAWGDSPVEAMLANDHIFHWTNCSPQYEIFNQADRAPTCGLLFWATRSRTGAGIKPAPKARSAYRWCQTGATSRPRVSHGRTLAQA